MPEAIVTADTQGQFESDTAPMELDLTALFNVMQDEVLLALEELSQENLTPEQIINELEIRLFGNNTEVGM